MTHWLKENIFHKEVPLYTENKKEQEATSMKMREKAGGGKKSGYMLRRKITPWCILFFPMAFTVWLKYYPIFSAFFISLFR